MGRDDRDHVVVVELDVVARELAERGRSVALAPRLRLVRQPGPEVVVPVVLDDVLITLQRAEMTSRMAERIKRDCVELGSEGRLIRRPREPDPSIDHDIEAALEGGPDVGPEAAPSASPSEG